MITDEPSHYENYAIKELVYTYGSRAGNQTVSTTGHGIYAYVHPFDSSGSWCLDLFVKGMATNSRRCCYNNIAI